MPRVRIGQTGDVPAGEGRVIEANGHTLALFNVDGAHGQNRGELMLSASIAVPDARDPAVVLDEIDDLRIPDQPE